ncbi:MAG TPA: response regulator [Leptospiraceae bacterium]|nr:response regulator [Leptospiraceae bacterium]HMW04033.1 response regulator [Leptospiraceae bacterium]HMX30923.1 response regulator [Leptospiraceae bacterium]HMY30027.1 response regulator [Leptospiraceae bacterium]HMZ62786.1 response regulator [Leptospiraceae bacterium]
MKILIVDDNDRYANNLKAFFDSKKIETERAYDAKEGWEKFQRGNYHTVISDITMETQTSGLFLVRKIFKSGYKGNIIIATTGFDFPGVMFFSKYILPFFAGVGWMIPKVPLKRGEVIFFPTQLVNNKKFEESL